MFNVIGFPILLISLDAFFTSGEFILYCFDSVQLAIAREIFDLEGDVGLFIPEVVRYPIDPGI